MIWWIDLGINFILILFFGFLAFRILLKKKAILISSTMYCSMLMLGLFMLSLQDLAGFNAQGGSFFLIHWKAWLFFIGSFFYIFLIPKVIQEFYIFHISEKDYRSILASFFETEGMDFAFDPETYTAKTEKASTIQVNYHFAMKFAIWSIKTDRRQILEKRNLLMNITNHLSSYAFFSWQGFFFALIAFLLLIRSIATLQQGLL